MQAMVTQVSHDHSLLAERIARLTGAEGSARLEAALAHVRQQVAAEIQAAEEAASEASWETASEAGRWVVTLCPFVCSG
jgi:glycine cleavage system regulatory protein